MRTWCEVRIFASQKFRLTPEFEQRNRILKYEKIRTRIRIKIFGTKTETEFKNVTPDTLSTTASCCLLENWSLGEVCMDLILDFLDPELGCTKHDSAWLLFALLRKYKYLFLENAENLTTYGCVLWCSQIVSSRHYSLNIRIAFYSVNEWSNFAVSVWSMACQATPLSHFT